MQPWDLFLFSALSSTGQEITSGLKPELFHVQFSCQEHQREMAHPLNTCYILTGTDKKDLIIKMLLSSALSHTFVWINIYFFLLSELFA